MFLTEIRKLLEGKTAEGQMPDEPDNITLLNYSGGAQPERELGKGEPAITRPTIQVRVRNKSYFKAMETLEKQVAIINNIKDLEGIKQLNQMGDVLNLGRDAKQRYEFSVNFMAIKDNQKKED